MDQSTAIQVESLSKKYQLGYTHAGSINEVINSLLAMLRRPKSVPVANAGKSPVAASRLDDNGKSFWALKDINFEVKQGDVVGVIGRNGSGKSTLLKLLSRISYPTEGRIKITGRTGSLLEVGTGFHPELSGRENVFMNGTILGMSKREVQRKFDEIVEFSGIENHIDTPVKRYSSGMRVRLAFAVAAHLEPELLIIDEVLAVGDASFQAKCLGKMSEIGSSGRTILFVSHNMEAIKRLCNRGLVIHDGRLVCDGNVDEAIHHYLHSQALDQTTAKINAGARIESVNLLVNGNAPQSEVHWVQPNPIELEVCVRYLDEVLAPRIDLSFYRNDGLKLFTLRTDTLHEASSTLKQQIWRFKLKLGLSDIGSSECFLDIGVSDGNTKKYVALWNRAWNVSVSNVTRSRHVISGAVVAPEITDVSVSNL